MKRKYSTSFLKIYLASLLSFSLVEASPDIISLSFVETGHNFFSGEEIERTLVICNNTFHARQLNIRWQTLVSPAVIQRGEGNIELKELGNVRFTFPLRLPEVKRRVGLDLKIQVFSDEGMCLERIAHYSIFPRDITNIRNVTKGKKIGLFDPEGKIREILEKEKVAFDLLSSHLSLKVSKADLIIIGPKIPADMSQIISTLKDKVQDGISVVCFESESNIYLSPVGIPAPFSLRVTSSAILAPGHPIFTDLNEEDIDYWRNDGMISNLAFIKPEMGNFKVLLEGPGSITLLIEVPYGKGKFIISLLSIVDKFNYEPAAQIFFENLIRYGLMESKPMGQVIIYGNPEIGIVKFMESVGINVSLGTDNLRDTKVMIVCFDQKSEDIIKQTPQISSRLAKFIHEGDSILIFGPFNEVINFLEKIIPGDIWAREYSQDKVVIPGREKSLFWGMNDEEYKSLVKDGKIASFILGKTEIIICQSRYKSDDIVTQRAVSQLLTNLRVEMIEND